MLVAGGQGVEGSPYFASAEIYDPATGIFSPTGSMADARSFHTATLLPDGRVLVAGGFEAWSDADRSPVLAAAELYDPSTGTFGPVGP